jgi:hypothetical protein
MTRRERRRGRGGNGIVVRHGGSDLGEGEGAAHGWVNTCAVVIPEEEHAQEPWRISRREARGDGVHLGKLTNKGWRQRENSRLTVDH